jgi:regulator of sigma E protease
MLTTVLSFILVLGILVFIHELGHFLVAKKVGIRVEKFSLGFPPNIFSKTFGETTYCIGLIPLGGFVKMIGENPEENPTGAPYEFMSKTIGQRTAVIIAGPFMNYLLAIVLMIGIIFFGGRAIFDDTRVMVGDVPKDKPAYMAGLRTDDQIIAVNGNSFSSFDSVRLTINKVIDDTLTLTWVRGSDTMSALVRTLALPQPTEQGGVDTVGVIGFAQKPMSYERFGLAESIQRGFVSTHVIVWETVKFLQRLVTGEVSAKMMGGPLFIAQQSGNEARKGAANLFFFMALLSVNLAVLNILPIPILDGGHLVFLGIEKLKGSPLSVKARAVAQQVGMVVLLGLIVFVTYNDILRMIRGY